MMNRSVVLVGGCLLAVGVSLAVMVRAQPPDDRGGRGENGYGHPPGPPREHGPGDRHGGPPRGGDRTAGPPRGQRPESPPNPFLEMFDTDRDGQISADEIATASNALKKLDANDDGSITREELPRPPRGFDQDRGDAHSEHDGRPVELIARDLGVTPEAFREAFKNVRPAPRGQQPSAEQRERNRKVLAEALGVDPQRLDAVMDKYRPGGATQQPSGP